MLCGKQPEDVALPNDKVKEGNMKMKNRLITMLILLLVLTAGVSGITASADGLTGSKLEKEMREMIDKGILSGYEDGSIRPKENVTRAQFAAFVARALNLPEANGSFKDVPNSSKLAATIYKVNSAGLMSGYSDNTFKPDDLITREQVAITMENVLKYSKKELVEKRIEFTDQNEFGSSTSIRAVFYNTHYEIISGIPNSNGTLRFEPKSNATREQAAAFISRFLNSQGSITPPPVTPPPVTPPVTPPVVDNSYKLATIANGKLVKDVTTYEKYADAAAVYNATSKFEAIYHGNELVQVKSGIAFSNKKVNNAAGKLVDEVTIVYAEPEFKTQLTYIEYGREMRYIESNDKSVKVQVGGSIGYVQHSDVDFIPLNLITNRDYYMASTDGTLNHFTVNHANGSKNFGGYPIGQAPSFMTPNVQYYSYDGVHFSDLQGTLQGIHYSYFQFLSIRTKSNYTAEELDRYIQQRLKEVTTKHPTALQNSKLIGLGQYIKQMEAQHNVNALFILGAAMHESDSGMSKNAQEKNNLFGIQVFDSRPEQGLKYLRPEDSITAYVTRYVNGEYGPQVGGYAKGAVAGNKTSGMNVHYASDPNWGSKIAGHMWRADKFLGNKDRNVYERAITAYSGNINVRSEPDANSSKLFSYKPKSLGVNDAFGYPLVIIEKVTGSDGYVWYKVLSDSLLEEFGWIREKDGDLLLIKSLEN